MAVKTGHAESLQERGDLTDLFATAMVLIRGNKRGPSQRAALRKALQFFQENRLAGVISGNIDDAPENLLQLLSLQLRDILPRPAASHYASWFGVKYVGEMFRLPATAWRESKRMHAVSVRHVFGELSLPFTLDVEKMGWIPPYMSDPEVLAALSERGHVHGNFRRNFGYPYRTRDNVCTCSKGCVTVGEFLRSENSKHHRRFNDLKASFKDKGLHLGMYIPEEWRAPAVDPVGCALFNRVQWDGFLVEPRLQRTLLEKGYETLASLAELSEFEVGHTFGTDILPWVKQCFKERNLTFSPLGDMLKNRVSESELSVRSKAVLINAGLLTLEAVAQKTEGEFIRLPNAGRKCLNEVRELLLEKGLAFRQPEQG